MKNRHYSIRLKKINSLLREVIASIIIKYVSDPKVDKLVTITYVKVTADLRGAKVFVALGNTKALNETIQGLNRAKEFIAVQAAKEIVLKYFPRLHFCIDKSLESEIKINNLLDSL